MGSYQKLKCAMCGYELASRALKPRCTHCGSRKFNCIDNFSPVKKPEIVEEQILPQTKHDQEIKAVKDIVDKDFWGEE